MKIGKLPASCDCKGDPISDWAIITERIHILKICQALMRISIVLTLNGVQCEICKSKRALDFDHSVTTNLLIYCSLGSNLQSIVDLQVWSHSQEPQKCMLNSKTHVHLIVCRSDTRNFNPIKRRVLLSFTNLQNLERVAWYNLYRELDEKQTNRLTRETRRLFTRKSLILPTKAKLVDKSRLLSICSRSGMLKRAFCATRKPLRRRLSAGKAFRTKGHTFHQSNFDSAK